MKEELKEEKIDKKEKKKKNKDNAEIEALKEQVADLQNKLMYSQAELINYRKRMEERTEELLKYKNAEILEDLTDMVDNLKRAISVKAESEESKKIQTGIVMINDQFMAVLKKYGVTEIEALNLPFDANYMEAMMLDNDDTKPDEMVTEVLIPGYKYKDRVLKHAVVKVNKNENKEILENDEKKGND